MLISTDLQRTALEKAYDVVQIFNKYCPRVVVIRHFFSGASLSCPAIQDTVNTSRPLLVQPQSYARYLEIMAPKGKGADKGGSAKGKGKGKTDTEEKGVKVKGAQQINVRHILVRFLNLIYEGVRRSDGRLVRETF